MKHLKPVCRGSVAKATEFQDIMCDIASIANALLGFLGGSSPIFLFVEDKCTLPQPNTTGGTSSNTN